MALLSTQQQLHVASLESDHYEADYNIVCSPDDGHNDARNMLS